MRSSFWFLIVLSVCFANCAIASEAAPPLCFDFKSPVKKPLAKIIKSGGRKDSTEGGKFSDENLGDWGAARGQIAKPLVEVYRAMLDPFTVKDPEKAKVNVIQESRPGFAAFQIRELKISPFPLINLNWTEQWAFVVTEGKDSDPREMVISYQKTEGTSHIKSFCGSMVLRALGKNVTDVFIYEQMNASRRNFENIIESHLGTFRTLRKPAPAPSPIPSQSGKPS